MINAMGQGRTPTEVFHQLVNAVCEERWDDAVQLYAEHTDVSHPFAPDDAPPLLSRDDLSRHFTPPPGWTSPIRRRPANIRIHETADPEVIVAEFEYQGENIASGKPFTIPCVFVMRVRNGQIVESRDYIDHARSVRARSE
jgi:ketosteroid isomerase-like protein